jgi:hypothetical protein
MEIRAGRLIEARVFHLRDVQEINAYSAALGAHVAKLPGTLQPILLADHRPVVVYTQQVADRLAELFASMNSRLERVAILVARTNATLLLQLDRIAREAGNAHRRVFHAHTSALEHLQPALDAGENARARAFIAEWQG